MRWLPLYLSLRERAQVILASTALSILAVNSLVALLFKETVLTFQLVSHSWSVIYVVVIVWALVYATYNALFNGVAKMPLFMMPDDEKQKNIDDRFCMVALVSLVFVPMMAVPVLMSVNIILTN